MIARTRYVVTHPWRCFTDGDVGFVTGLLLFVLFPMVRGEKWVAISEAGVFVPSVEPIGQEKPTGKIDSVQKPCSR